MRAGVNVAGHAGSFLAIESAYAGWLILPALAVGAVTRTLTSFEGMVVALFFLRYMPTRWLVHPTLDVQTPLITDALVLLPMLVAGLVVIGLQYAIRSTFWNRVALVVSVVASGVLMPLNGVAVVTMHALNDGFDPGRVQVDFDETATPVRDDRLGNACWSLTLKVAGLPAGAVLSPVGIAKGETQSVWAGIRKAERVAFEETGDGYRELICTIASVPQPWLRGWSDRSQELRVTQDFQVLSTETVASMAVRHEVLEAGDAGRCEFLTPFPENTQLRCELAQPALGAIAAGLEYPGYKGFSGSFVRQGSFGLSPVYRAKFDGDSQTRPSGWPLSEAEKHADAKFVLRRERVIGTLRREMVYHHIVFPWLSPPPPITRFK